MSLSPMGHNNSIQNTKKKKKKKKTLYNLYF